MKRVNFYLAEVQIKYLESLKSMTGLSVSEHIRRAITIYIDGRPTWEKEDQQYLLKSDFGKK